MDEADLASEQEERNLQQALLSRKRLLGPIANGRCHWCDEIVPDEMRWCDAECAYEWERRRR